LTASSAIGEIGAARLPRLAFVAMSATTKNLRSRETSRAPASAAPDRGNAKDLPVFQALGDTRCGIAGIQAVRAYIKIGPVVGARLLDRPKIVFALVGIGWPAAGFMDTRLRCSS
jgi:hypothetical protein